MHAVVLIPIAFILIGLILWWIGKHKNWELVKESGKFCVFWGIGWLCYMLMNSDLAISVTERPHK
jgi:uncharacterized Tic20 family protein